MADEASIIDALVVTLGIDASQVVEGRKTAEREIRKLREESLSNAKLAEAGNKRLADSVGNVKSQVLGLTLAFAGATGVKDFVGSILSNDAAVGRFAANIGLSTQAVSAWQYAVQSVGGSANDAMSSMQAMFNVIEAHRMGQNTAADTPLRMLGITQDDANKGPAAMLAALAENRTHLNRQDRSALLSQVGLDQNSINTILLGSQRIGELSREADRLGTVTAEDARQAERLQAAWNQLTTSIRSAARPEITALAGSLADLAKNGDNVKLAGEGLAALIGGIGAAALIANPAVVGLAVSIFALVRAYDLLSTKQGRGRIHDNVRENENFLSALWGAAHADANGDTSHIGANMAQVIRNGWAGKYRPTHAQVAAGNSIEAKLRAHGLSEAQARGVAAGIYAESGGNPNAVNPTSGAYGIAQWLGPRKRALFAMYGPNPTLDDQISFMTYEMKHKERGAAARIGASSDPRVAALAFLSGYERPGPGLVGDMRRADSYLGARLAVRGRGGGAHHETHVGTINVNGVKDGRDAARRVPEAINRRRMTANAPAGMSG